MKIIVFAILALLSITPAYAYLEDNRNGETQWTAGEQNSAFYKLEDKSKSIIKRLKQADEYVARAKSAGRQVNVSDFEELLISEQEEKKKQDIKRIIAQTEMSARAPLLLVVPKNHDIYAKLQQIQASQVRDTTVARQLKQQLR